MNDEEESSITKYYRSIDEFPLPPSTPRLASFCDAHCQDSVPEFNRNFRFPSVETDHHKLDDPERTFKRLRHESDVLAARLAHELTVLESPTRESSVDHGCDRSGQDKNISNVPSKIRPITSYSPVSPPRFPFKDFAGWDLTREADEPDDAEHSGENVMQPHVAPRVRASSLHCRISPWRKERLEFIFPAQASERNTTTQYHQSGDREYVEKEQEERILRETRKAAMAISKAGFNFGFEDAAPALPSPSVDTTARTIITNSHVESEIKSTSRRTLINRLSRLPSPADTPLSSAHSQHFAWPLDHGDSGVEITSFSLMPKSAPPCVSRFPDLPSIMRHKKGHEPKSETSQGSSTLQGEALSAWSPTPEIEKMQQETEKQNFMNQLSKERKKRWGFLGKMKSSMFWRKKSETEPQSLSCLS